VWLAACPGRFYAQGKRHDINCKQSVMTCALIYSLLERYRLLAQAVSHRSFQRRSVFDPRPAHVGFVGFLYAICFDLHECPFWWTSSVQHLTLDFNTWQRQVVLSGVQWTSDAFCPQNSIAVFMNRAPDKLATLVTASFMFLSHSCFRKFRSSVWLSSSQLAKAEVRRCGESAVGGSDGWSGMDVDEDCGVASWSFVWWTRAGHPLKGSPVVYSACTTQMVL
jgi:hypothetical protein